jgi:glucosamine-6-phosphate deaminase
MRPAAVIIGGFVTGGKLRRSERLFRQRETFLAGRSPLASAAFARDAVYSHLPVGQASRLPNNRKPFNGRRSCLPHDERITMKIDISATKQELGQRAAATGAEAIRAAIAARGQANVIVATGASQFEMLDALVKEQGIDWTKVTFFHLDEYAGMEMSHPASFRKYLQERFVDRLPQRPAAFHYLQAEGDCQAECQRLGQLIAQHPIDVAFIGIGENGHLAFNDPPADFDTAEPYIVVLLDVACRQQQYGEGWFPSFEAVPTQAISMSVKQILKSKTIICSVPDERKAQAVQAALEGSVSSLLPASILQTHADAHIFLDTPAAALLRTAP